MTERSYHGSARPRRPVLGHSHVPRRAPRWKRALWRIFRPARWRAERRAWSAVGTTLERVDYSQGPTAWADQPFMVYPNQPRLPAAFDENAELNAAEGRGFDCELCGEWCDPVFGCECLEVD